MARLDDDYKVALIVPVYNEEDTIATFVSTVESKLEPILEHLEIVFVDDGSKDKSAQIIEELMEHNERIALIKLSRNFGKEAAMTAAIDMCDADALIPIDVDLQDPPELVLEFVKIWREQGVDTVYGKRVDRSSDSETKRISSGGFYYVFNKLSGRVKIPENVGDFRLIDSKIIQTVRNLNESNRFMKGLYAWPGFTSCEVDYVRPERSAGTTKWNYWKLWNFALDGIVSFSSLPLRVWSYIGAGVGFLGLIYMVYILVSTMIKGVSVPGYASLMCVVLFLGSIQLISIGVLGEYLGRVSEEVKKRPVYVVSTIKGKLSNRLLDGYQKVGSGIYFNDKHTTKASASASVSASASDSASAASASSQATDSAAANDPAKTEK
ncbi:glycosyltransferase family 2 protein [Anaerobiospirillum sp. NML120448]|uniref:glycosyltransferase family 2 protein n=1 Tax=Anaerobiospirillum sp. NML120448 TaxID=2932816 RepID=UPI001FF3A10B|nr:glycosyltransferase family 2 protein [Anaerobiospirillum sp. NML120448]MCK0515172.1 glycosyltransferase family 2 protein [Anaerobiospirillum sp. NML120448]